jgi:hypothetical protein
MPFGSNCGGNDGFDQEAFGALDTPFGERLILFRGASWIGMAFENQVGPGDAART